MLFSDFPERMQRVNSTRAQAAEVAAVQVAAANPAAATTALELRVTKEQQQLVVAPGQLVAAPEQLVAAQEQAVRVVASLRLYWKWIQHVS